MDFIFRLFWCTDLISLRAALIYDAVMVFASAMVELGREQVLPTKILCDDPTTSWNKGNTILNFMKKARVVM